MRLLLPVPANLSVQESLDLRRATNKSGNKIRSLGSIQTCILDFKTNFHSVDAGGRDAPGGEAS